MAFDEDYVARQRQIRNAKQIERRGGRAAIGGGGRGVIYTGVGGEAVGIRVENDG